MRSVVVLVGVLAAVLGAAEGVQGEGQGLFGRGKPKFKQYKLTTAPYQVEYPDNWQVKPAADGQVTFSEKKGEASVVVDRQVLNGVLTEEEVRNRLTKSETARLRETQPESTGVQSRVEQLNGRLVVILD